MSSLRISIVTPSFNQANFLNQTISSVLDQNYENLEYIVIDGGSNDGSIEIIEKYASRLHYWVSEKDRGQSDAINKGFSKATGDIYGWINSDDYLLPGSLKAISTYFSNESTCDVINGGCLLVDQHSQHIQKKVPGSDSTSSTRRIETTATDCFEKWTASWFAQQSTFWRSNLWQDVGGLRTDLHYAMDFDLWMRFARLTEIKPIPDVLAAYRFHSDAKCSSQWYKVLLEVLKVQAGPEANLNEAFWDHSATIFEQCAKREQQLQQELDRLRQKSPPPRQSRATQLKSFLLSLTAKS
ncbi:MAG: glycosyltransferase family 2 protein [Planctomycetaceae bacterium]